MKLSVRRVQGLNTELQNKLLDQRGTLIDSSRRISELSKQEIQTLTGGKSFCFIVLSTQEQRTLIPIIVQVGKQPLYDVHARIINIRKLRELEKQGTPYLNIIQQIPHVTLTSLPPSRTIHDAPTHIDTND